MSLWRQGLPVEFVFLGGNAGQQADKAAHTMMSDLDSHFGIKVVFVPCRVLVRMDGASDEMKDAFVWKVLDAKTGSETWPEVNRDKE